jgi:hypothetical protein
MYSNKLQGYYLISNQFSESFNAPGATSSLYTMILTQKWYNTKQTNNPTSTASQTFYYDALTGNPFINTNTNTNNSYYTNTTSLMYQVSGINVITTTATFNLSINVTNLYQYFYVSPVLNYEFSGGCTGNTNVSNLTSTNYNYNYPIFTLNNVSVSVSSTFKNTQTLKVTAYNLNGSTGSTITATTATPINAIYDKPSYNFINDTQKNPTSIQEINALNLEKYGCRVWSNVDKTSVNSNGYAVIPPYYTYTNNYYSYYQFPYNQSWSIVATQTQNVDPQVTIDTSQEIQIYNGHYGTGKTNETNATGENGYINYSSYYQNTLNYLNVSRDPTSYRYTTFVWKLTPPSGALNYYNFTFKNIKVNNETPSVVSIIGGGAPFALSTISNPRFFLFYRTGPIEGGSSSSSSVWVDGNSTYGTINDNSTAKFDSTIVNVSSTNYNDPLDNTQIRPANVGYNISEGDLVAKVDAIKYPARNTSVYIYCRFGNAMSYNVSYNSVSLFIT